MKKKKNFLRNAIILLFCLLMVISPLLILLPQAQGSYSARLATNAYQLGNDLEVTTIRLEMPEIPEGLSQFTLELHYDPAVFNRGSINTGAIYPSLGTKTNDSSGTITITYQGDPITSAGIGMSFELQLKANAPSGTTTVRGEFTEAKSGDTDISVSLTPVDITVKNQAPSANADATLSSLSLDGYSLSPNFSATTYNYTCSVPYEVSLIPVSAVQYSCAFDSTAVSVSVPDVLQVGENTITVHTTAQAGNTATYTITVTRLEQDYGLSQNNYLSSLTVGGTQVELSKDKTSYTVAFEKIPTDLQIQAVAEDENATVDVKKPSNNTVRIFVTAENKEIREYIIHLLETANEDAPQGSLQLLSITGAFDLPLQENVYNYTLVVPYEVTFLEIQGVPSREEDTVEITGGDALQVGENTVYITVTTPEEQTTQYTLQVTRLAEGESLTGQGDDGGSAPLWIRIVTYCMVLLAGVAIGGVVGFFVKIKF